MGKAKRPTGAQEAFLNDFVPRPKDWLVLKDTPEKMVLVGRGSGKCRTIKKSAGAGTPSGKR